MDFSAISTVGSLDFELVDKTDYPIVNTTNPIVIHIPIQFSKITDHPDTGKSEFL
jgi:hypothetical protein